MKTAFLLLVMALGLTGCSVERHRLSAPGRNQVIHAESGDRFYMDLEEDSSSGCRWQVTSDDRDVEVKVAHKRGGAGNGVVTPMGTAEVEIRVHRGFDGPCAVTFVYRNSREKEAQKRFTVTLFRRTGNFAFWE